VGCLQTILADDRTEVLGIWSGPRSTVSICSLGRNQVKRKDSSLEKMDATSAGLAGAPVSLTSRPPLGDDANPYCYSSVKARLLMGYAKSSFKPT
jgi:hypothetical protein